MVCKHPLNKVIRNGFRKNKSGLVQKYKCKHCGKKFSFGRRNVKLTRKILRFVRSEYRKGTTLRGIARKIGSKFDLDISHSSVYNWLDVDLRNMKMAHLNKKLENISKQKQKKLDKFRQLILESQIKGIKTRIRSIDARKIQLQKRLIEKKINLTFLATRKEPVKILLSQSSKALP